MSTRRGAWTVVALVCMLAMARVARAQSVGDIRLQVTPDARGCITEAALRARIASLRVRAEASDGLAFVLDAASQPEVLQVRRNDVVIAVRRFETLPERCTDRLQTIALVMTLAMEHAIPGEAEATDAAVEEPEAEAEPAPPQTPTADGAVATKTAAPPARADIDADAAQPEREPPVLRTVVGAGGAYGLLPELAGTLAVGVELPSSELWIGLGALVTSQASTALAGGEAVTRLAGARAYGCATARARLELLACAGAALAVVSGSGRGYAPSVEATGTLLAPLLRIAARYPADGWLALGLALEGLVHLVQPELQVSGNAGGTSTLGPFGGSLAIEAVLAVR